jgi:hypothetical protein
MFGFQVHVWFAIKYTSFQNRLKQQILIPNQKRGILKKLQMSVALEI